MHYHVGLHTVTCWATVEYFVHNESLLSLVDLSFQLLIMVFRRQWRWLKIIRMLLKLLWLLQYCKDKFCLPVYSIRLACHQTQSILQVKCKGMLLVTIKWAFFVVFESIYLTTLLNYKLKYATSKMLAISFCYCMSHYNAKLQVSGT